MNKKYLQVIFCVAFAVSSGLPPAQAADLSREVRVYLYRPQVFADRSLGPGLPAQPATLKSSLWYLRMEESVRELFGMGGLATFLMKNNVPGLDFTDHKTFTDGELEMLFRPDRWLLEAPDPAYKFRLLKLAGTATTDRALATVGRLFDLQVLMLSDRVSDKGMRFLASLKQLRVLSVPGFFVTDKSLDTISQLKKLERLSLQGSQITDAGLKKLAGLPLRQLDLGPQITDIGLLNLRDAGRLEHVDIHASRVTAAGLTALARWPRIHTLFLGPSIHDSDVGALLGFKNLQRLDLSGAQITDAGAAIFAQMPQLEELALTDTPVTEKTLHALSRLPKLRYLDISRTRITPDAFKTLKGFSALQVLSFSTDRRLNPEDVKPLGRLLALHSILINNHPLGRALVRHLQQKTAMGGWNLDWLIPPAEAEDMNEAELGKALEVASLPLQDRSPSRGIRGLPMIHASESALDDIVPAPSMIGIDNQQDSEKNFLGEITVEADGQLKIKK